MLKQVPFVNEGSGPEDQNRAMIIKKVSEFLKDFPKDATSWAQATDEPADLYEYLWEMYVDILDGAEPAVPYRNTSRAKTPAEFNTKFHNGIMELLNAVDQSTLNSFVRFYGSWFGM